MNGLHTKIKGYKEIIVTDKMSAKSVKSGELDVFATPSLIALVEETAWNSVAQYLSSEQCTVGTKIEINHIAPTSIGVKVSCETELTEIDGRKLTFSVLVYDEVEKIAEGVHERFIVNKERFIQKSNNK